MDDHIEIYRSFIPGYVGSAHKIYLKQYDEAISDLIYQLEKAKPEETWNLAGIHVNLTVAYFKSRTDQNNGLALSSYHAKEALKWGHNTGFAPDRLIINLVKDKRLNQAIEVCKLVLEDRYTFLPTGRRKKKDFVERLAKLEAKLNKHPDSNTEPLFTRDEKEMAITNSNKPLFKMFESKTSD